MSLKYCQYELGIIYCRNLIVNVSKKSKKYKVKTEDIIVATGIGNFSQQNRKHCKVLIMLNHMNLLIVLLLVDILG